MQVVESVVPEVMGAASGAKKVKTKGKATTKPKETLGPVESANGKTQKHDYTLTGRPVVQSPMRYHDLLSAIRKGEVRTILMATGGQKL